MLMLFKATSTVDHSSLPGEVIAPSRPPNVTFREGDAVRLMPVRAHSAAWRRQHSIRTAWT